MVSRAPPIWRGYINAVADRSVNTDRTDNYIFSAYGIILQRTGWQHIRRWQLENHAVTAQSIENTGLMTGWQQNRCCHLFYHIIIWWQLGVYHVSAVTCHRTLQPNGLTGDSCFLMLSPLSKLSYFFSILAYHFMKGRRVMTGKQITCHGQSPWYHRVYDRMTGK